MGNGSKILDASVAVSIFRIANSPQLALPLFTLEKQKGKEREGKETERIFEKEREKINYFQTREVAERVS